MRRALVTISYLFFAAGTASAAIGEQVPTGTTANLRDGDLIFQQSQSAQSEAIREGTGSPWTHVGILVTQGKNWYVAEASSRVTLTPLSRFIQRGRGHKYVVERVRTAVARVDEAAVARLKQELMNFAGDPYDIYFEWSDDAIYCSELVYKSYQRALGLGLGAVQKFRDLNLEAPAVKRLIKQRLEDTGRELNLDEPIVTPVSQMSAPELEVVVSSPGPNQRPNQRN